MDYVMMVGACGVGVMAGSGIIGYFYSLLQKAEVGKINELTDLVDKQNKAIGLIESREDEIKRVIREDRENFLKVDAFGMTRDELAAFKKQAKESGMYDSWPEDPCEAVKKILAEWHSMHDRMQGAVAAANAAEWRSSQYESLSAANAELVEIIAGVRDMLSTGPHSPFGAYTGRFPTFSRLVLFLLEQALRAPGGVIQAQAPPEITNKSIVERA